jgi:hypothetical protein
MCGVCRSRGTHKVGAETAAPAVGCHCGVIVTGFTEGEATERWNILARRAEIGRLVEELAKRPKGGLWVLEREDGKFFVDCDRTPPGSVVGATTLLEALRALAKEVGCE